LKNPYPAKKKAVGINLSPQVVDYFKGLADETGLPYQKLMNPFSCRCTVCSAHASIALFRGKMNS